MKNFLGQMKNIQVHHNSSKLLWLKMRICQYFFSSFNGDSFWNEIIAMNRFILFNIRHYAQVKTSNLSICTSYSFSIHICRNRVSVSRGLLS